MALPVDEMYRELGRMYTAYGMRRAGVGAGAARGRAVEQPARSRQARRSAGCRRAARMDDLQMQPPSLEPRGQQSPQDSAANKPATKAKD